MKILGPPGVAVAKRITKESIERLKTSFRLEDFLRNDVEIKKSGGFYQGKCPFHNDDSPSFTVYPDHYYCFGCKANGDAITFLMERDGLRFHEAVEMVAGRMGVQLDYEDDREINPEQERRERARKESFYILQEVADLYHRVLLSPEGRQAQAYLMKRGYPLERIREFRLGLSLEVNIVCDEAQKRGWPLELLERIGLVSPSQRAPGRHYDFFRHRILIPIRDEKGNVVGFGGRTYLPPVDPMRKQPKYQNSRESEIFSKSTLVYNLDRARGPIARTGSVLLVEGYFDCLTLAAHGVDNVVAALSTSLTPQHLDKLAHVARAKELIVSFDADGAGQAATLALFRKVFPLGRFTLRYLSVPDGKDPDEFVRAHGREAFVSLLGKARPLMDKVCEIACEGVDVRDVEKRLTLVREKVLPAIEEHPDPAMRDLALQSVASFLRLSDHRLLAAPVSRPAEARGATMVGSLVQKAGAAAQGLGFGKVVQGARTASPPGGDLKVAGHTTSAASLGVKRTPETSAAPGDKRTGVKLRWLSGPEEMKLVCSLLYAERGDLPPRLRALYEGTEVIGDLEVMRLEICQETLARCLTEDSKEIVRDLLHVQHELGGRSVLLAAEDALGEMAENLKILLALAKQDEMGLRKHAAQVLLEVGSGPLRRRSRKDVPKEENVFEGPSAAALRLALRDAECSARQGTLRAGLDRVMALMERDHLNGLWRAEGRHLAEAVATGDPRQANIRKHMADLEAALALIGEELETRKKNQDEGAPMR